MSAHTASADSRLVKFEEFRGEDLAFEVARTTRVVRVYEVADGRYAWGNERSTYYPLAFQLSLDAAKRAAEGMRTAGSWWVITELPGCAFIGSRFSLIITEVNAKYPLLAACPYPAHMSWAIRSVPAYNENCKPYLNSIAERFSSRAGSHLQRFLIAGSECPAAPVKFEKFVSSSIGARYMLSWSKSLCSWNLQAILDVTRSHSRSLEVCSFLGITLERGEGTVTITGLHALSPLSADGLKVGDVIRWIGRSDSSEMTVDQFVDGAPPGETFTVRISRDGKEVVIRHRARSFSEVLSL